MFFEKLFLTSITATKSIFYLVGFLVPRFLTKISPKKANHKNARIFLTYVPPSLSSAAYLPLPLPTTTCRCLPLPATKSLPATTCNYLLHPATTSTYHYLPLPAGKEYLLFGLFFKTLVFFATSHPQNVRKKNTFFGQKRSEKTVRCKWPTLSRGGPLCDSIRHCKL